MTTADRLHLLDECAALFEPFTGPFGFDDLAAWVTAELGDPLALDQPIPHGPLRALAVAPARLLHVVSGNTPHAAFQSLLRALVVGARSLVKLPGAGLPAFETLVSRLPGALSELVETTSRLPDDWATWAEVVVVFGGEETLAWFASEAPPTVRLIPHGQKLSIALVSGDPAAAARLAACDVSLFDQRGCLSVHDLYVTAATGVSARDFAARLAAEMEAFNVHTPRHTLDSHDAGTITSIREAARFSAATNPEQVALWQSEDSTAWTVIYESDPRLKVSPLHRVVFVKPWPEADLPEALGPEIRHLSTIALHPFDSFHHAALVPLGATRFCPLGKTQDPSLFWHHDGLPPLASLVTWVDFG